MIGATVYNSTLVVSAVRKCQNAIKGRRATRARAADDGRDAAERAAIPSDADANDRGEGRGGGGDAIERSVEGSREDSVDEEELERRARDEEREADQVSRRVFGAEVDDRALKWTRSIFLAGAFLVALAAWPRAISWLCSYFEPLDTAVAAFESLTSNVGFDLRIMRATATATFKMVALCAVITGLMRDGKLPLETPVVVSKLAFNVMLPAYLCTRVAATLYMSPLTKALAVLPMSAVAQVIFGSFIGVIVTSVVNKFYAYTKWYSVEPKDDAAEEELVQLKKENMDMSRLGIAACAFGNTFTLPLVFLTEVLGRARADETAGYIALYLIGWTPVLWTVGFLLIAGPVAVAGLSKDGSKTSALRDAYLTTRATLQRISKELLNPPLLGIIAGVLIGATPLKEVFVGNFSDATTDFPAALTAVSVVLRALFELAASIGAAALPGQMLVLASSLVKITPEDVERRLAKAAKAKEKVSTAPAECEEEDDSEECETTQRKNSIILVFETLVGALRSAFGIFGAVFNKMGAGWDYLCRLELADVQALASACLVRFVALPAACLFGLLFLRALNSPWFPTDSMAALVLLTMSCMPAAQNLVLLTQLREATRPMAPRLAALMLRQYVIAIVPVTFWLTAFTSAVA
ncbi:AEC family transporter: auxin efflux [Ostreococcus tauri]|uniref:AEC family transporter: auxin efflux n=1 Tax=Ostreococcus tauri TaxID=70448 RepID=A0A1Y5I8S2_OSTTA|nr:AEC family transporter: auxin efflux [Ostreococcus tauri]